MDAARSNAETVERLRARISTLQAAPRTHLAVLRTGVPAVDALLPAGGFPLGQVVELWGSAASGRTCLALRAVAEAHRALRLGGLCGRRGGVVPAGAGRLGRQPLAAPLGASGALHLGCAAPVLSAGLGGAAAAAQRSLQLRGAGLNPHRPPTFPPGLEASPRRGRPFRGPSVAAHPGRDTGRRLASAQNDGRPAQCPAGGGAQPAGD